MNESLTVNNTPLVSVIIVCYNGKEITRKCLQSIFQQTYRSFEVIVIDNGSNEDISTMVETEFPQSKFIRLEDNLGFAGGNNVGLNHAEGQYIALINNDACASPDWLSQLVKTAQSDPQIGSIASIIVDGNIENALDSCGVGISFDGMSRQRMKGFPPPHLEHPEDILMPSGCACLLNSNALKEVGYFDEHFFAYCEDTDLGLRLRWAGYKSVVAPDAFVTHYYSKTLGAFSLKKVFWVERNHYWVVIKNFPLFLLLLLPVYTIWRYTIQLYLLLHTSSSIQNYTNNTGKFSVYTTILKATFSAIAGTPLMLYRRCKFHKKKKINDFEMFSILRKYRLPMIEIINGGNDHAGK